MSEERERADEMEAEIMAALDGERFAIGMTVLTKCITNVMIQFCDTPSEMEGFCSRLHENINALWAANNAQIIRH